MGVPQGTMKNAVDPQQRATEPEAASNDRSSATGRGHVPWDTNNVKVFDIGPRDADLPNRIEIGVVLTEQHGDLANRRASSSSDTGCSDAQPTSRTTSP